MAIATGTPRSRPPSGSGTPVVSGFPGLSEREGSRTRLADVRDTIVSCERCPRLREYCDRIAREKRRAFKDEVYRGSPCPGSVRLPPTARRSRNARAASPISPRRTSYPANARINGRLTLGETTADNGGLRLALMAYLAGPGATPQPALDGW